MNSWNVSIAMNGLFDWLRRCTCVLDHSRGIAGICRTDVPDASPAAMWIFAFGVWMLLLGSTFLLMPALNGSPPFNRFQAIAKACGFPEEAGIWSRLFGVAIATFGFFYFAGALFESRPFFWMTVFGRLGVFGICTFLAWRHRQQPDGSGPARPHTLLWFATPDLLFATITAWVMLTDYLARVVFVGGIGLLTAALGFFTFPGWIMQLVGVNAKPDTWNIVLGALLAFFGVYGVAAALFDLSPILWAAIWSNTIMLAVILLGLIFDRTSGQSSLKLKGVVAALFLVTAITLVWAIQNEMPAVATAAG